MNPDMATVQAARAALEGEAGGRDAGRTSPLVEILASIAPHNPLDVLAVHALRVGRQALERQALGWRRMARTGCDETWRAACTARAEEAERYADSIGDLRPGAAVLGVGDQVAEQEAER